MKRLLFVAMLLAMVALGAGSASAYEGCAAFAKKLKDKGLIDATKEAAIVYECKVNGAALKEQCTSACTGASSGSKFWDQGCRAGCNTSSSILIDN